LIRGGSAKVQIGAELLCKSAKVEAILRVAGFSILSSIQSSAIDAVIKSDLHSALLSVLNAVLHLDLPHVPSFIISM
jgi:hypothetical protein